jgi:hypothetical protein
MVKWIKGDDVKPVPEEGLYIAGEKILMPAMNIISEAYNLPPSFSGRNKLLRAAAISYAKNKDWKPSDKFNSVKPMIDILINHKLWEKMEILGAMIHLIVPQHEAAVTVDIAANLGSKGLGLVSVWPSGLGGAPAVAPWAEMGSAVATLADRGVMIEVCSLIQVSDEQVKIELHNGDEVLQAWVDALYCASVNRKRNAKIAHPDH